MRIVYKGEELGHIMTDKAMKPNEALKAIGYDPMDISEMDMREVKVLLNDAEVWQDIDDCEPLVL